PDPPPFDSTMASISSALRMFLRALTPRVSAMVCNSATCFPSRTSLSSVLESNSGSFLRTTGAASLQLLVQLLPVRVELGQALVRQRMLHQLHEHLERQRRDVGAGEGRLHHVHRVPERGREDLRVVA